MKTCFYPKLAVEGIRKNKRFYIPYILTCVGMAMMYYIIHYLSKMPVLDLIRGGGTTRMMLGFGTGVMAVFAFIFLIYTNSFLMRRRQKEFGLYNILGMGKKNISIVYFIETVMIYMVSMATGIVVGIAFSKMAELILLRMIQGDISYDFTVRTESIVSTLLIYGVIFSFILAKGLLSLWRLHAIHLLKSESVGEKPVRANYLLGFCGIILLGAAYYIAVSIKNPLAALELFFVAVIMVIIATYMLFVSGSVMLCKLLQKNKNYYYQKNHFVSVSSMVYRMKRNGAGLASICILSTMVLVIMLGAGSLYFGAEDSLQTRYPRDIHVEVDYHPMIENEEYSPEKGNAMVNQIEEHLSDQNVATKNVETYVSSTVTGMLKDGELVVNPYTVNNITEAYNYISQMYFIPLESYNECMGKRESLQDNEVLLCSVNGKYEDSQILLPDGTVLKVKTQVDTIIGASNALINVIPSIFLVVKDFEKINGIINAEFDNQDYMCQTTLCYGFDTDLTAEEEMKLQDSLQNFFRDLDLSDHSGYYASGVECREAERQEFYGMYGGIFFLGILLSIVFLFATVLITYYKQMTEGFEDEARFNIMRKVGMTKTDIKKNINSQMVTVFFFPLIMAIIHVCFAFPMVKKLLLFFNLTNTTLMLWVLAITVLVFAVFYGVVYNITSNAYCSIVSGRE